LFTSVDFSEWREQVNFHLAILNLELALLEDKHVALTSASTEEEKSHHKVWNAVTD
jgi:hypothetical protein